jgi:hypothetical protein
VFPVSKPQAKRNIMSESRIPGNLGQIAKIATTTSPLETIKAASNTQSFSNLMQKSDVTSGANAKAITPFDLAQGGTKPQATAQSLLSQVNLMQDSMKTLQGHMGNPNLKLKPSQKYLVKNKLSSMEEGLNAVNSRLGGTLDKEDSHSGGSYMDGSPEDKKKPGKISGPIGQFLNYVTDGVQTLESVKGELASLGDKKKQLTPGDFLFIQVKLAKVQQEMEFTSAVLTKVQEDFKTIINIQL